MNPRLRTYADRPGLPPLLVVQAGPGLPLFHEIPRFQALFQLERSFEVTYWDQRGCGDPEPGEVQTVAFGSPADDLLSVLRILSGPKGLKTVVLGVSLGASLALLAAAREPLLVDSVIAVSPDLDIPRSDQDAWEAMGKPRSLGPPPYLTPSRFQHRLRLLADLGSVEQGRSFLPILLETLTGLVRTYGVRGTFRCLQNMERIQKAVLPSLARFRVGIMPHGYPVPVHYLFGSGDLFIARGTLKSLSGRLGPSDTLTVVPGGGHLVHFDAPDRVKELVARNYP